MTGAATEEKSRTGAPLVTVGVPVYNGAQWFEKSLTCLRDQTFRDFEVLIYDNCSDDGTPEIAQRFCAEDPRFRYFRQPENKGEQRNFIEVMEAARSPYFMWRAADDISDLNYIEKLAALLQAHPEKDLAASRIVNAYPDGRVSVDHRVSPAIERGGVAGRLAQIFLAHPGWYYGLYRREAIAKVWPRVLKEFPYLKVADVATLFVFSFDRKVIGTNETAMYGLLRSPRPRDAARRAETDGGKIERARALIDFANRHVDRSIEDPARRFFYRLVVAYFGAKHGYSLSKRLRQRFWRSSRPAGKPASYPESG
jgi:glycosyltransferase involved in cell wall biosynthesis